MRLQPLSGARKQSFSWADRSCIDSLFLWIFGSRLVRFRERVSELENLQVSLIKRGEVEFRKNPRARRYVARIDKRGVIVLTVPSRGTQRDALEFANLHAEWLRSQQAEMLDKISRKKSLTIGDQVLFEGEWIPLSISKDRGRPILHCGRLHRYIADESSDHSQSLAEMLKLEAKAKFPDRVWELANYHRIDIERVTIRGQKTRWGSCSSTGTISLNWKLMQAPAWVRDYVFLHELMHRREMNHSHRFWALVAKTCPDYEDAEKWLNKNAQWMIE